MRALGYIVELIAAAILAALLLSNVSFAAGKCKDEYYELKAGILRHTCDNRFFVNKLPIKKYLENWRKNVNNKKNPSSIEELWEVCETVSFLRKRWKTQQEEKGKK